VGCHIAAVGRFGTPMAGQCCVQFRTEVEEVQRGAKMTEAMEDLLMRTLHGLGLQQGEGRASGGCVETSKWLD